MNKLMASKFWWLSLLILLAGINFLASLFHYRLDLTSEKRYTLSAPTKKLLKRLNDQVTITVLLDGDMPAGFKKLSNSTRELLQEYKELAGSNIVFKFSKPLEGLSDSAATNRQLYLDSLGIRPTNVKVQVKAGESQEESLVYPAALVQYKDRELAVDLLQGQDMTGGISSLNNAEALLEYKFDYAIQKITAETVPAVGYLVGNGQPLSYNVYDLVEGTLKPNYGFGFVPVDSVPVIPLDFDAIVIVKPTQRFTDEQKLKIDQYIMHGGKVIWLIDKLEAEMDSLGIKSELVAYDRNLNLDDLLFRYGVRINNDLLQDLQCDQLPLAVGNYGDQPQMQLVPWPYFPLLSCYSNHPIARNMDNVLSRFPNSMDTVKVNGIKKTVLLASSQNARTLTTPAIISLNSVRNEEDLKTFNKTQIPVAVLLEGKFSSLYTNRLSQDKLDTLAGIYQQPFRAAPAVSNKMIVIADADIVNNVVTQQDGPMPMGFNQFTRMQYANKEFFLNCMEYLVNNSGILETRSKDFTLRLLDVKKVENDKKMWQILNILLPVILVLLFGFIYQALRKRKYQG